MGGKFAHTMYIDKLSSSLCKVHFEVFSPILHVIKNIEMHYMYTIS